jgi:transcriptional regulator with XRE-family HTH domain
MQPADSSRSRRPTPTVPVPRTDNGSVVRQARLAAGLTQAQLGQRTSYSAATISRFETGCRSLTDVDVLRAFAAALAIPPAAFGLASPRESGAVPGEVSPVAADRMTRVIGIPTREDGGDVVHRRELLAGLVGLTGAAVLGGPTAAGPPAGLSASELLTQRMEAFLVGPAVVGMPVPMAELSRSVARSRALFERCRYGELAAAVPDLVSTAEATAAREAGLTREVASRLVAETYQIASELCVKLNDDGFDAPRSVPS